jgi:hypothetical protein
VECDEMLTTGALCAREVVYTQRLEHAGRRYAALARGDPETTDWPEIAMLSPPERGDGDRARDRRRSSLLQSVYADVRGILSGPYAVDVDLVNGDFYHMLDLHRLYTDAYAKGELPEGAPAPPAVRGIQDYVDHRTDRVAEIAEATGADPAAAKRLPNVIANGGTIPAWALNHDLPHVDAASPGLERVRKLANEVFRLRSAIRHLPRYKSVWEAQRARKAAEGKQGAALAASCFAIVLQTRENEVLTRMDKLFWDKGFAATTLVFDGLIARPLKLALDGTETPEELQEGQQRLANRLEELRPWVEDKLEAEGYHIRIAFKSLGNETGHYQTPRTILEARLAVAAYQGE